MGGLSRLDAFSAVGLGHSDRGITFGTSAVKTPMVNSKKIESPLPESLGKDPFMRLGKDAVLHKNRGASREPKPFASGANKDFDTTINDRIRTDEGFSFRQTSGKSIGRPSSAYFSESRVKTGNSLCNFDEAVTKEANSNFLSNLNKLKEFNSRGASVPREQFKTEKEQRPPIGFSPDQNAGAMSKKSGMFAMSETKQQPLAVSASERLGVLQPNNKQLEQKRTELRGRLNELLDKLAVSNSVRGETRSVAPQLARDGDDNLSLNSFHSTAPQATNLKSSAAGGFTSFYK